MKKSILIIAVAAIATFVYLKASTESNIVEVFDLSAVEAVAGCEAKSDPNLNQGYCIKEYNSVDDRCMDDGPEDAVRCSGSI